MNAVVNVKQRIKKQMVQINYNKIAAPGIGKDLEVITVETPKAQDNIGQRVSDMLQEMIEIQVKFSKHPTIPEDAGYFRRVFQDWKMKRYASIAASESAVASYQLKAKQDILKTLEEAALFLTKVKDQADYYNHKKTMRDLAEEKERIELEIKRMELRTTSMEAQRVEIRLSQEIESAKSATRKTRTIPASQD